MTQQLSKILMRYQNNNPQCMDKFFFSFVYVISIALFVL